MARPKRKPEPKRAIALKAWDAQATPIAIRALEPGEWITFGDAPGLRIGRSGATRSWHYRYRSPVDGALRQIRLGRWPATPYPRALAEWVRLRDKRDEGRDPKLDRNAERAKAKAEHAAARAERKREAVTVERIVRKYLAEHINRKKDPLAEKSRYDATRMFEGRVLPALGEKPAHAVTRPEAAKFLAAVKLDAPALARLLRSKLGAAWDHAIDGGLLPAETANPWRDALRGKLIGKPRARFLDDAELATFLARLPEMPALLLEKRIGRGDESRDALHLALLTGARTGEVVAMDWSAVDLKRGTWTIADTKTDAPRTIRLPRQAVAILERRAGGFDLPQQELSRALRETQHLGLRHFTPHDVRRSVRTGLSRIGVRDEVAEAALGHVQGGIRGTYNLHAYEAEVGKALQAWADHLDALQAPEVKPLRRKA